MNRILFDKAHSMLKYSGLDCIFWGETIKHAANLHNRTVTAELNMKTPMESFPGTSPNNPELRISGYASYVRTHKGTCEKMFMARAQSGIYFRINPGSYRVYVPQLIVVRTTKHVTFDEQMFLKTRCTDPVENNIPETR